MDKSFSPREMLKNRRPERFSDSVQIELPGLDRLNLEYHLDSLTNRSQETEFQRFAFELAKREVCPNLLPQTGPTGGGDSKVDTETFPVADTLSLIWSVGIGREASNEKWGFAVSAKEDWAPKLKSDVSKIVGTERGYKKAFFITNQFVPDKRRAAVEDELTKEFGIDVKVLDRSWILDRVFSGKHEALAIEQLDLPKTLLGRTKIGPLDTQRQHELDTIEARIKESVQIGRLGYNLVEDCIETAKLARGLEQSRTSVEGLLQRAERLAHEHGTHHQQLEVAYQRAWTAYWWYEDYREFARLYPATEKLARGSTNGYDLERLTNLWMCLQTAARNSKLSEAEAELTSRTSVLCDELTRLSRDSNRPSTSLLAQTLNLHVKLHQTLVKGGDVDSVLIAFQSVILGSENLIGYPLEPVIQILSEMGMHFGERSSYANLFAAMTEVVSKRRGDIAAAGMLSNRGAQHVKATRYYEAIRYLGQALRRLYKHESRHDFVRTLYLLGYAYEQVGLLWAARGSILTAASVAMNDFWTYGEITGLQGSCTDEMKWIELQLGRLPQLLSWQEVDQIIKPKLIEEGCDEIALNDREMRFDGILGMLLLKSTISQLELLTRIPDVLDRLSVPLAADALRHALGHKVEITGITDTGVKPQQFYLRLRDQPAFSDLPEHPQLYDEATTINLFSPLLGCKIVVQTENVFPCVELGESVLAVLESMLATGASEGIFARETELSIIIEQSDQVSEPFTYQMLEMSGRPSFRIYCQPIATDAFTLAIQHAIKEKLSQLTLSILAHVFFIGDPDASLTKLFKDELALERSVAFTSSFINMSNALGKNSKSKISAWVDEELEVFPVLRTDEWDSTERSLEKAGGVVLRKSAATAINDESHNDSGPYDYGRVKHTRMQTFSLIREPLWNRAKWSATLFMCDPSRNKHNPPLLGPAFKNAEAAKEIFALWQDELGRVDLENRLRVTIVRGISKKSPHDYRVIIGSNIPKDREGDNCGIFALVARIQTMSPPSSDNLERFLRSYQDVGAFFLVPSEMKGDPPEAQLLQGYSILLKELVVKNAWEIGCSDPDLMGLLPDDDPIIPSNIVGAPVAEVLRSMKEKQKAGRIPSPTGGQSAEVPKESPKTKAAKRRVVRKQSKRAISKNKRRK